MENNMAYPLTTIELNNTPELLTANNTNAENLDY